MDENYLEMAGVLADTLTNAGIAAARKKPSRPIDFEGFCDCGAEVLSARLAHGFYNCVDCQTKIERHNKLHRRA